MSLSEKKVARLLKYIERWTRCEIMSRYAPFADLEYVDYAIKKLEYEDRIRKLCFGNPNAYKLGEEWGILKKRNGRTKINKKMKRSRL